MTKRQYDIATGMLGHVDERGYAASIAEIARMLDRSTTVTFKNLQKMRVLGMVDWVNGEPRTMHVTPLGRRHVAAWRRRQTTEARASRK